MIEERRTQELAEREKEKEVERAEAQAEVPEEEVKVNGHGEAFEGQPEERTSGGRRKKS
jgi:hypothetical protein